MVNKLKALIALSCLVAMIGAWPLSGMQYTPYTGPCDHVTCAEAWSVTRAMLVSYNGPLFQLSNGVSTLNIGQTAKHKADMSTWSAFCSGVASNCTISKVYAQINITSNDLTPFNSGNPSVFTIEAATGLPLWVSSNASASHSAGQQYTVGGASDNVSTGINAAGTAETVILNAAPVEQPNGWCCGMFGTAHVWNDVSCPPCTAGTDFLVAAGWGQKVNNCTTKQTYCVGLDQECCIPTENVPGDGGDYSATKFPGAILAASFDPVAYKMAVYVNGVQLSNHAPACNSGSTPACTLNSGLRIHYGGGGDLSGPELVQAREMLITNSALSQAQVTAVVTNSKTFYPTIKFPSGPNNPATYASGPGDVVSGAKYFNGFRAYTAAIAAAGTQSLIEVENRTSTDTCQVLVNPAGGLGNTTGCTHAGENGQPVNSFCTSNLGGANPTTGPGMDCLVVIVYDQVGNVANYTNIGSPLVNFMPYCINFTPCALFPSGGLLGASITLSSVPQPYTMVAIAERSDSTAGEWLMTHETGINNPAAYVGWNAAANQAQMETNTGGTFPVFAATGIADNVFHIFNFIFNGSSSSIIADGVATTGTVGSDAAGANPTIRWGNSANGGSLPFTGQIAESGLYPFALSPTQRSNLRANQLSYWGLF